MQGSSARFTPSPNISKKMSVNPPKTPLAFQFPPQNPLLPILECWGPDKTRLSKHLHAAAGNVPGGIKKIRMWAVQDGVQRRHFARLRAANQLFMEDKIGEEVQGVGEEEEDDGEEGDGSIRDLF